MIFIMYGIHCINYFALSVNSEDRPPIDYLKFTLKIPLFYHFFPAECRDSLFLSRESKKWSKVLGRGSTYEQEEITVA